MPGREVPQLSPLQGAILRYIGQLHEAYGDTWLIPSFAPWRPGWDSRVQRRPASRSNAASLSRALRRLEKRGLVVCKRVSGRCPRTFAVALTPAGRGAVNNIQNALC